MNEREAATRDWFGARLAGIAAVVVTASMLYAVGAAAAPGGEKGNPESKPQPAEPEPQPQAQRAPQSTRPAPQSAKPAKPAKPAPTPRPAKPAKPGPQPQSQGRGQSPPRATGPAPKAKGPKAQAPSRSNPTGRGPAGKETFCHSTRSATNPFVTITTSVNALLAHDRHHAGDDIIPATNGECPGNTTPVTERPGGGPDDGGPGGPGGNGANGIDGVDGPGGPGGPGNGDAPGVRDVADSDVLGASETSPGSADRDPAAAPVAGSGPDTGGPRGDGSAPAVAEERADDGGSLPFTGRSLAAILVAALLALAVGLVARRVVGRADA
jgi:hypothetical protein